MKRMQLIAGFAAGFLACGGDDGIVETTLPPGSARVVLSHTTATGSQVTNVTTTVDSVSARYETVTCVAAGTSACPTTARQDGEVNEAALGQLFALAQTEAFRALGNEYKDTGDDVPPDGGWMVLTVRAGTTEKTVRWEANYLIPPALARIICWIDVARGSLAQCA
jgi:hypothetical protein